MDGWTAILISMPVTFAASWFGGRFHRLVASSHIRVQTMLSFVGGLMLGMALLHLLPHAVVQLGSIDVAMYGMLVGVIGVFLLMRFLHVHSHSPGVACVDAEHEHSVAPAAIHEDGAPSASRMRWLVLLSGLGLHSVVDGLAIASAVRLTCGEGGWPGLAVLVVVMLHKPIDAVSLTGTMAAGGETGARRKLVNLAFASVTPLATLAAYGGFVASGSGAGMAMAIAAGAFVCVALADLMPEVQFHSHHRVRLTLALVLGVSLAWAIGFLEHEGQHDMHAPHHGHDHD